MRDLHSKQPPASSRLRAQPTGQCTPHPWRWPLSLLSLLSPTIRGIPRGPQACPAPPSLGRAQMALPSPLLLQHVPGNDIQEHVCQCFLGDGAAWRFSPLLLLAFLGDGSGSCSAPSSAGPSGEQSMPSHWYGTAPSGPGMLLSQSHSHLGNGLIHRLKRPLLARGGVHPLLCLAASLLSLSSAMVRRMPFPRGREIHGLLPCSKGEAATSHQEIWTGAELSLMGGKAAEASPYPALGHVHRVAAALAQQKPLRKAPKVYQPYSCLFWSRP